MERLSQATTGFGNDSNQSNAAYSNINSLTIKLTNEFISDCAANDSNPQKNSFIINISSIFAALPLAAATKAANDNNIGQPQGVIESRFDNIPPRLQLLDQWLLSEPQNPKRPCSIDKDGRIFYSGVNHVNDFMSFERAKSEAIKRNLGIGLCLLKINRLGCIDIDSHKLGVPDNPIIIAYHKRFYDSFILDNPTYSERSVSDKNTHIWIRADAVTLHKPKFQDEQGNIIGNIDILTHNCWVVFTGNTLNTGVDVLEANDKLLEFLSRAINQPTNKAQKNSPPITLAVKDAEPLNIESLNENDEAIKAKLLANISHKQLWEHIPTPKWMHQSFQSQSEADLTLVIALAKLTLSNSQVIRLFRESGLGQREKAYREDYVNRTIANARGFIAKEAEEYAGLDRFIENLIAQQIQDQAEVQQTQALVAPPLVLINQSTPQFISTSMDERIARTLARTTSNWLIKHQIGMNDVVVVFGASGTGKSFLVLDMAVCIASGIKFHGKGVTKTNVYYIAGEGNYGLDDRLLGFFRHYVELGEHVNVHGFRSSEQPASLMSADNAKLVAEDIRQFERNQGPVGLIIVDTFHRNLGEGDENSAKDMATFLSNVDAYLKPFNATVLIVHHSGLNNTSRARGSSSLRAALETEIMVETEGELMVVTNTKMKNRESPPALKFNLLPIALGAYDVEIDDDTGLEVKEERKSLVLQAVDTVFDAPFLSGEVKVKSTTQRCLKSLMACRHEDVFTHDIEFNKLVAEKHPDKVVSHCVSEPVWRKKYHDDNPDILRNTRNSYLSRAKTELESLGRIVSYGTFFGVLTPDTTRQNNDK
jgi:hypothetical protein